MRSNQINNLLKKKKYQKILIITGKNSYFNSSADIFLKKHILSKEKFFFFKKEKFPQFLELIKIINAIRNIKPNLIIAIGGGTVLDYAKIANFVALSSLKNLKKEIVKSKIKEKKNFCDLLAIPTTAGSGAEVTSTAVIYINKKKYSVESPLLLPKFYCLIFDFVKNNPRSLKASSGFDALAQSIESLLSIKSNKLSIKFSKESLKIISKNYLKFVKTKNINTCKKMLKGANLAGRAINISRTTAPHAVSYPYSILFGLSHGHAVSLFFEKFLRYNYNLRKNSLTKFNLNDRFKLIFKIMNVKNIDELCLKILNFKKKANLVSDLKRLNINHNFYSKNILEKVSFVRLKNNPVALSKKALKEIIFCN